ncbi:MAG TPA: helical backbone metal receptor, partial [Chloroflexota bacterium]|nr:helical backbone metal receptor [Chloroflexota bacterium]
MNKLFSIILVLTLPLAACGPTEQPANLANAPQATQPAMAAQGTPSPQAVAFPMTIADDTGRQVLVKVAPARIVSLSPSNTEILFALGLGERIAAVTSFCNYPEEAKAKPKVGGMRPNVEAVVALAPEMVLAVRGVSPDVVAGLEALGVPVIILNPPDFSGVLANVTLVGRVTGASAAAQRLTADMQRRWNAVADKAK